MLINEFAAKPVIKEGRWEGCFFSLPHSLSPLSLPSFSQSPLFTNQQTWADLDTEMITQAGPLPALRDLAKARLQHHFLSTSPLLSCPWNLQLPLQYPTGQSLHCANTIGATPEQDTVPDMP